MARWTARCLVALIGCMAGALLLGLAEVGTRLGRPYLNPLFAFLVSPHLQVNLQFPGELDATEFDPQLIWRLKRGVREVPWCATAFTTNAHGLRMDHPLLRKARGTLRVVCLGDSVTWGYGVPFCWENKLAPGEKIYTTLLEERLRAIFPGRQIEVINAACPGYTSRQGLTLFRRLAADFEADIVTACFGRNDVHGAGIPDRLSMPDTVSARCVRELAARSQLVTHLANWRIHGGQNQGAGLPPGLVYPRQTAEEYVEGYWAICQLARSSGAEFLALAPTYRGENTGDSELQRIKDYRAELRRMTEAAGLPFLEIEELTERAYPQNKPLFIEEIHPNAAGHRLMAERLSDALRPLIERRSQSSN